MDRLSRLKNKVDELYQAKNESRAKWADWLYGTHVFTVANEAGVLAERFHAEKELAMAAGMLHDIADAVVSREDPGHEETGARIAKEFLQDSGFADDEIGIIVDDAMKFHGCHGGNMPQTLEGKVMATADAVVHLTSDFYGHCVDVLKKEMSVHGIRKWALPKLERDFNDKIFFDEIRTAVRPDYEKLKIFFTRDF
jgi:uncharacterized protein